MPVYAALSDLLQRYEERELVQLTDDAGNGAIDEVRIDQAVQSATATIDGYLATRYQLPLARVPGNLVDICCEIARFKLWRSSPPENVEKGNAAALKALEQISRGIIKIDAGVEEQAPRDGVVLQEGPEPLFKRDRMSGF